MKCFALLAILASAPVASAGIFNANEPCPFEVSPEGTAKPLPLNVFKLYLNDRVAALNPASPDVQPGTADSPTFKSLLRNRVNQRHEPGRDRWGERSADLLRLGRAREVIELLKPTLQDRTLDYVFLSHLALAHAELGDWDMAVKRFNDAFLDGEEPAELAGTKPEQLKWMLKIDRAYTRLWLRAALHDADPQAKPTDPDVLPLFREAPREDSIAVVQQLVLWAPLDANLLWLLGSLYLEKGQFAEAFDILEQCRDRKLTWPKFRARHAHAEAGYRALPKATPDAPLTPAPEGTDPPPAPQGLFAIVSPEQFWIVVAGFVLLVVAIVALQVRKLGRRPRGGGKAVS